MTGHASDHSRPHGTFRYYVGLNVASSDVRHDPAVAARKIGDFVSSMNDGPGGCTVIRATGFFEGEAEEALVVYVAGFRAAQHADFLRWLVVAFEQVCIAYEPANQVQLFFSGTGTALQGAR